MKSIWSPFIVLFLTAACSHSPTAPQAASETRQPAGHQDVPKLEDRSAQDLLKTLLETEKNSKEDRKFAKDLAQLNEQVQQLQDLKQSQALSDATKEALQKDIESLQERIREASRGMHGERADKFNLTDAQINQFFASVRKLCGKKDTRLSVENGILTIANDKTGKTFQGRIYEGDHQPHLALVGHRIFLRLFVSMNSSQDGRTWASVNVLWDAVNSGTFAKASAEAHRKPEESGWNPFSGLFGEETTAYECINPDYKRYLELEESKK